MRVGLLFSLLLGAAVLLGALATPAARADDVYRGPGGSVPPGLREPSDPTPPPPPPPTGPLGSPMPAPVAPAPTAPPPVPTTGPEAPYAASPEEAPARSIPLSFEDWSFGWHYMQDAWLRGDPSARRVSPKLVGEARETLRRFARPDAKVEPAVAAEALVALGRSTDDPADLDLLLTALSSAAGRPRVVRRAAALGLGLLRRDASPFPASLYVRARNALLEVVEDADAPSFLRGVAAASMGLLGGQADPDAKGTTSRLWRAAGEAPNDVSLCVGVLLGLGGEPRGSLGGAELEALRGWVRGEPVVPDVVRAWATIALGRVGDPSDERGLETILFERRHISAIQRRSAALALGSLGRRLSGSERGAVADRLLQAFATQRDTSTRAFALDSLRVLLMPPSSKGPEAGGPSEAEDLLRTTLTGELLLTEAAFDQGPLRGWAALELGVLLRAQDADAVAGRLVPGAWPETARLREKALHVLDEGLRAGRPRARAAFGFARALAQGSDAASENALAQVAADRGRDKAVRAYATLGLGLRASLTDHTKAVLRDNLFERSNESLFLVSTEAADARDPSSLQMLAWEVSALPSPLLRGAAAMSLARAGTDEAARALLLASGRDDPHVVASAVAGLGCLLDSATRPWQATLFDRTNYRASTDVTHYLLALP